MDKWMNNSIQFPRLICEIVANVELTEQNWNDLLESMDLESGELHELFDRANEEWERIKNVTDSTVDPLRPATFLHLIMEWDELTQEQKDESFVYHAATGGDILWLRNGEVIYG